MELQVHSRFAPILPRPPMMPIHNTNSHLISTQKELLILGPTLIGLPESTAMSGADVSWLKSAFKLII